MVTRLDPAIIPQLRAFGLDSLEQTAHVVLAVWADGRVAYVNPAWEQFALENGAAPSLQGEGPIGRNVFDLMAGDLAPFYRRGWQSMLAANEVWQHRYECSSPTEYREYVMLSYPLHGPDPAVLIVHSLVVSAQHDRLPCSPIDDLYRTTDGIIVQCANCRRVRAPGDLGRWDWVPEWVDEIPPMTSHGVCAVCLERYYR